MTAPSATDEQKARAAAHELVRTLSVWEWGVDLTDSNEPTSPTNGALDNVKAPEHRPAKPRVTKPKIKAVAPPSVNAVGKPFSPQYDPHCRLKHRVSYGHLRLPYPTTMRFVGDPPPNTEKIRGRRRKGALAPLLDADHALVDLIDRLEEVRGLLETASAPEIARTLILTDDALRAAVEFLVQLREERLGL
jgi:hypothetical protein